MKSLFVQMLMYSILVEQVMRIKNLELSLKSTIPRYIMMLTANYFITTNGIVTGFYTLDFNRKLQPIQYMEWILKQLDDGPKSIFFSFFRNEKASFKGIHRLFGVHM